MLKSMHAEEDAKYTESRSLSTRFVRSLLRYFVPPRPFVRSFVGSSKGHFLTTAPLTPSRFLTSVGEERLRWVSVGAGDLETSNRYMYRGGSGLQALSGE